MAWFSPLVNQCPFFVNIPHMSGFFSHGSMDEITIKAPNLNVVFTGVL
jgi:hypothetical protein